MLNFIIEKRKIVSKENGKVKRERERKKELQKIRSILINNKHLNDNSPFSNPQLFVYLKTKKKKKNKTEN